VILDPHFHGDDVGFRENRSVFVRMTGLNNLNRTALPFLGCAFFSY